MNRLLFEQSTSAELESVRSTRLLLEQVMKSTLHKDKTRFKISLCLAEAMTNIIEHSQPTATEITVRFEQRDQQLILTLIDDGGHHEALNHIDEPLEDVPALSEDGRGLGLLMINCHDIKYKKETTPQKDSQNHLIFTWDVQRQAFKKSILLVEDDLSIQALIENYLTERYQVFLANDGEQALIKLNHHAIDLVISDIHMPIMNGLDLRSKISENPDFNLIPFIFLTASDNQLTQSEATKMGIDDYLVKPISKDNLLNHTTRILKRSEQIIHKLSQRLDNKISNSFIPKIPKIINQWQIALVSMNTGQGGGDFVLHQSNHQQATLALFDMMGHDETAKFFSYAYGGFISGVLRSQHQSQCHHIMKSISNMAYDDELLSKITLTGQIIELHNNGQITIANGAHPYPYLITECGLETIKVEGMLPGLLPDTDYKPLKVNLAANQRLALFTDGLYESADNNEARKILEQKVKEAIQSTLSLNIDDALEQIIRVFNQYAAQPLGDDTTLLLLQPL